MERTKPVLYSKTVLSLIAAILVALANLLGFDLAEADATAMATDLLMLITLVIGLISRITATKRLVWKKRESSTPN